MNKWFTLFSIAYCEK